jgi:hypothetical protein
VNLERMTGEAIREELKRQRALLEKYTPDSQLWLTAMRIIHHLTAEQRRRTEREKRE